MSKPIIPWMGGKRRLAKQILPHFPKHECYVEPFAGGAALFFMREPARTEVINDINGELVNLYRVVKHHLDEFCRMFRWALVSREMFSWAKLERPETLTDIQRAARFFYLQKLAFGGRGDNPSFGTATTSPPKLNLLRVEEDLSAAHLRLSQVYIEHLPWMDCVKRYDRPHTLFYCDPPYWQVTGYGVEFGWDHYIILADTMRTIEGKMIISINDHPDIRSLFSDFRIQELKTTYTVGGGGSAKPAGELLIFNWAE